MASDLTAIRAALRGISGVHVTPYDASGGVDHMLLSKIVARLADAGIHNIVSAGNTGEFFALTEEEVRAVHATAVAAADGKSLVTAAVGRSFNAAIAAARAAAMEGADAVLVHLPADPFAAPRAQADYFIAVAEQSSIPTVAYVRTDAIAPDDFARIAQHPNIAGIKFASSNVMLLSECIRRTVGLPSIWVCGLAEGYAPAFYAAGARGFTSGLVNVFPQRSLEILAALDAGAFDRCRDLIDTIAVFEELRTHFNNGANVTVVKEAMELMGDAVGPVRVPGLPRLDSHHRERLRRLMGDWGITRTAA